MENNITRQDLLTGDDKQDLILDQAKKIANDGMGGLEGFVKKYNPDLLLGTYTTGEKVAEILGLADIKGYTRDKDPHTNEPNYKYQRITAKGAELVKPSEFFNWISEKYKKIYKVFDEHFVEILEESKTGKKFKVDNQEIFIGNKGKWFFTNEALVVAAFISEKPKADAIADSFLQYVKMQEIKAENADVFQETINNIKENCEAKGIDFSSLVDTNVYNEYLRAEASNSVLEFSEDYYQKIDANIDSKLKELDDKRDSLNSELFSIDKTSIQNRIRRQEIETKINNISFNIEELLNLRVNIKNEIIHFKNYIKEKEGKAEYYVEDLLVSLKNDYPAENKYTNVRKIYQDLVTLGVLYKANNNYYPTDKYQWLYESCGRFQLPGKKGKDTLTLTQFGFDVFYYMLSEIIFAQDQEVNEDLIEYFEQVTPEELEALLYGQDSKDLFENSK